MGVAGWMDYPVNLQGDLAVGPLEVVVVGLVGFEVQTRRRTTARNVAQGLDDGLQG